MFAQHNTKLNHILLLNYIQIRSLPHIVWQFGEFLLGNLALSNGYFNPHRLSNTPANISISLLDIPNRVTSSLIYRFLCHNSYYFVSLEVEKGFPNALQNLAQLV